MSNLKSHQQLPIPEFFDPDKADKFWRVPYVERAQQAHDWARQHNIQPSSKDDFIISLVCVDMQNTFCNPEYPMYVRGKSGRGAVEDNCNMARFIYRNLDVITGITATLDSHRLMHVFHPIFLVNDEGNHPEPNSRISVEDIEEGRWKFNPEVAPDLDITVEYGQKVLEHYVKELRKRERFDLTIWPYHSMVGGLGHALVGILEEAIFFHDQARLNQADFIQKGQYPLTEAYSAIGPEVTEGPEGEKLGERSDWLFNKLTESDMLIIGGEAKSHCVNWTIQDLLGRIRSEDESLVERIYLLEDCTSSIVVPGKLDYSEEADEAFRKYDQAGMHVVQSTDPISSWPGV